MRYKNAIRFTSGILFTLFFGMLSQFFYLWSGENPLVGLFFPVNASVWEQMKLLFFPILFYTIFEMLVYFKMDGHFLSARLVSLLTGAFLIPCFHFIYTGFLGRSFLVIDSCIYVFCILFTFFLSRYLELYADKLYLPMFILSVILLFVLILFFSFSFSPPDLPLFQIPVRT